MNDPADDAVLLHLAELLDQHLLGDRRDRPFQLRKPEQLSAEQIEQDHQLPAAFENLQRPIDAAGGSRRRVLLDLTLG